MNDKVNEYKLDEEEKYCFDEKLCMVDTFDSSRKLNEFDEIKDAMDQNEHSLDEIKRRLSNLSNQHNHLTDKVVDLLWKNMEQNIELIRENEELKRAAIIKTEELQRVAMNKNARLKRIVGLYRDMLVIMAGAVFVFFLICDCF